MADQDRWAQPQSVSDLLIAFPARIEHLLPSFQECSDALVAMPDKGAAWFEFQNTWFTRGLSDGVLCAPLEGIDIDLAFRHLACIQRTYSISHQYKMAAVAYLASRWFTEPPVPAQERDTSDGATEQS